MRKIIVGAMVSMDGVMQAPGGPNEDPTKGFKFGGWVWPYAYREFGEELNRLFMKNDLLLGRKTYEIFAAYWPYYDKDSPHGGTARRFSEMTKYAVSRSGEVDTGWEKTVLLRDISEIRRLKETEGPDLVTQGSTTLVQSLLAHGLVDQMTIFTFPVVLGCGKKLFADGSLPRTFKLTRSDVSSTGVMTAHYEQVGEVAINSVAPGSLNERELARQERMKAEG